MIEVMFVFVLFFFGLVFGSFVNALVWRIKVKKTMLNDRSECVHCHHKLAPLDLIPVFSWLLLKGRCRYCKKPIDDNPFVELMTGLLFAVLFAFWPSPLETNLEIAHFGLWLVASVLLVALFVYDLKWKILPDKLVFTLIGIAIIDVVVQLFAFHAPEARFGQLLNHLYGLIPITGLYGLLYFASKGRLVGFGDVKLGIFIGLILGWQGAFLVLFFANVLGTLLVVPLLAAHKLKRTTRIPFGPFLIIATFMSLLFGDAIISWYLSLILV